MQANVVSFTFNCELAQFTKDWARQNIMRNQRYYCPCGWTCGAINGTAKGISSKNTKGME